MQEKSDILFNTKQERYNSKNEKVIYNSGYCCLPGRLF